MLRGFDRLLIRVESLPAAARYWEATFGAKVVREDRSAVLLTLPDGGDIVLHADTNLAEQAMYLLVDDVRQMHADRSTLKLDFRTPPTRGSRGYFATIRDPFGVLLNIADETFAVADDAVAPDMPAGDLFGTAATTHKPDRVRLAALYQQIGRTADDLPYTTHFETLYDTYATGFPAPQPDHQEVWRHLLTTRKAGHLPRLGAAKSEAPDITDEDRAQLRDLIGADIGKRDRLPYSPRFDELVMAFNRNRRRAYSPHQVWRLVATMSK